MHRHKDSAVFRVTLGALPDRHESGEQGAATARAFVVQEWMLIATALVLGMAIRAVHLFSEDFPLNDGGLFSVLIQDLRAHHYRLPDVTTYNDAHVPFIHAPLGLYAVAWLTELPSVSLLDIQRLLPLILNGCILLALYALARAVMNSRSLAIAALFAFALMPRSFMGLLSGGGVPSAFGLLFAVLALHQLHAVCVHGHQRALWLAMGYSALTALSHLGIVPFFALSAVLMIGFYARNRRAWVGFAVLAVGTVVLTAPWWLTIVHRHGFSRLLAGVMSGTGLVATSEGVRSVAALAAYLGIGNANGTVTGETLYPLLATLAVLGAVWAILHRRDLFVPTWWAAAMILDSGSSTAYAAPPLALLAGMGIIYVLVPLLRLEGHHPFSDAGPRRLAAWRPNGRPFSVVTAGMAGIFVMGLYSIVSAAVIVPGLTARHAALTALAAEERNAMEWVRRHTSPQSRFLVIPEHQWTPWHIDKPSAWFPALAQRPNVADVHGAALLGGHDFRRARDAFKQLRECAGGVAECVERWAEQTGQPYTHLYIPQPPLPAHETYRLCCKILIQSLRHHPEYELLYEGPGAVIFARRA